MTAGHSNDDWKPFRSLLGVVRLVLIIEWDPIGVFGYRDTLDEYDNYAWSVVKLLRANAREDEIEGHLLRLEKEELGLGRVDHTNRRRVARKLIEVAARMKEDD
jgi:hypothetical protein